MGVAVLRLYVVIVTTDAMSNLELFETRQDTAIGIDARDIVAGDLKLVSFVVFYDESGNNPASQAAEVAANAGLRAEIMKPERTFPLKLQR